MSKHAKNERLLIQTFPNSLTGPAVIWYAYLDKAEISSWEDLASAFMTHYKFNMELLPDRFDLHP